ncbi:MAG: Triosephosphate isomerase [Chlamydiae bacterium]|nr:Triosephosphate isomerase [Chlamydiota bacterium]
MAKRDVIIAGNWKMYKTIPEAENFVERLAPAINDIPIEVYLAVPYTALFSVAQKAEGSKITVGAQNMNDASEGAFTGEIASKMLTDAGAKFVILGHSERRQLFGETNEFINRKVKTALESSLVPILCVGETLDERNAGQTDEVVRQQLTECLDGVTPENIDSLIVAYEPVWAIGTGENATPEDVQEEHSFVRKVLEDLLGKKVADKTVLQYGGSVKPGNAKILMDQPDIDGLLIGGASLSTETFAEVLENVSTSKLNI